jgi:hypothetical protein
VITQKALTDAGMASDRAAKFAGLFSGLTLAQILKDLQAIFTAIAPILGTLGGGATPPAP